MIKLHGGYGQAVRCVRCDIEHKANSKRPPSRRHLAARNEYVLVQYEQAVRCVLFDFLFTIVHRAPRRFTW